VTQQKARESQLFEVATRLFKEKGYHNTSMQDLADALGLQKPSLYHYIESKEELLFRILERGSLLLGGQIDEIYAADLSPVVKLRLVLENHAVTVMEHLDLVSVYIQEHRNLPPQRVKEIMAARKHYERVLIQIVEDGIASGDFRPVNAKMAVLGFLGMLNWAHQWFSPDGELSPQEIAAILVDLALHGVAARPKGGKRRAGKKGRTEVDGG